MSTAALIVITLASIADIAWNVEKTHRGIKAKETLPTAYNKYTNALKSLGLPDDTDPKYALEQLYLSGNLNTDEYKRAIELFSDSEEAISDGWGGDKSIFTKDFWQDLGYSWAHTAGTHKDIAEVWNQITEYLPNLKNLGNLTQDEINDAIYSGVKQSAPIAAPDYNDTNIDVNASLKDVEPVKFWSGQELADLHNIDYDPNSYYDLIKQGTNAKVDLANFTSDQMNNASMYDDMANRTSYLDAIRSNKAEALSTGATLGQRAANEVLANREAIDSYAANQADVANSRMKAVDKSLLEDASAKLATREYFDKLAQSLSQDSLTLYANDTDRFGQDWLSNAERYKANQSLLAQNIVSNAEMYANYLSANAQINNYNKQASGTADEISWIFNNAYKAFDGDVNKAFGYTTNYVNKKYSGYNSVYDYLQDTVNK